MANRFIKDIVSNDATVGSAVPHSDCAAICDKPMSVNECMLCLGSGYHSSDGEHPAAKNIEARTDCSEPCGPRGNTEACATCIGGSYLPPPPSGPPNGQGSSGVSDVNERSPLALDGGGAKFRHWCMESCDSCDNYPRCEECYGCGAADPGSKRDIEKPGSATSATNAPEVSKMSCTTCNCRTK